MKERTMTEQHEQILSQIIDLASTAADGALELLAAQLAGNANAVECLLKDLKDAAAAISESQKPLLPMLDHAYTAEMIENIEDTLEDICRSIDSGLSDRAKMKTEFQLYPFWRQLVAAFYFWGYVQQDPSRKEKYYEEEFPELFCNPYVSEEPECLLSIVVPAYNHLDTTKQCIERLLAVTDFNTLDAELILLDHGSTDGTLEYFENLGIGKVIHLKKNIRMYRFALVGQIVRGRYFVVVDNDILVGKNWAENLLTCLQSDPKIIAAVPATPNIANLQMRYAPSNDPKEFLVWADEQNVSNPLRWNDRARLMPPIVMYRTELVSKIGLADPLFYSMEFWDDDFSFRARRHGYRQVVCDDAACYHFGSVTQKTTLIKENTLVYGRELFLKKNGVDAWATGFCYDIYAVSKVTSMLNAKDVHMLGIDCGLGDTPLQIRNVLRSKNQTCQISNITCQKEHVPDLKPLSDQFEYSEDLPAVLKTAFPGQQFDCVFLARPIEQYTNYMEILREISMRLKQDGVAVFNCGNPHFVFVIASLLNFGLPANEGVVQLIDLVKLRNAVSGLFSSVEIVTEESAVMGVPDFAKKYWNGASNLAEIEKMLKIEKYMFVCKK